MTVSLSNYYYYRIDLIDKSGFGGVVLVFVDIARSTLTRWILCHFPHRKQFRRIAPLFFFFFANIFALVFKYQKYKRVIRIGFLYFFSRLFFDCGRLCVRCCLVSFEI